MISSNDNKQTNFANITLYINRNCMNYNVAKELMDNILSILLSSFFLMPYIFRYICYSIPIYSEKRYDLKYSTQSNAQNLTALILKGNSRRFLLFDLTWYTSITLHINLGEFNVITNRNKKYFGKLWKITLNKDDDIRDSQITVTLYVAMYFHYNTTC